MIDDTMKDNTLFKAEAYSSSKKFDRSGGGRILMKFFSPKVEYHSTNFL